jgi:hypothetical protein
MRTKFIAFLTMASVTMQAQVGIGTINPQATLDIRENNPASPTAEAGVAIPQVSVLPSTGNRAGQLVFLTTSKIYYYYSGSSWQPLRAQVLSIGDVKFGFQSADHDGWTLLDGRSKSTLTVTQQVAATGLGIGSSLPNMADKSIVGVSATKTIASTGGNATVTVAQNQLPNVTLTTSTDGAHTHNAGNATNYLLSLVGFIGYPILNGGSSVTPTSSSGAHSHTTSSINGNVTQQQLTVQNPYVAMNSFIYLGS